MQCTLYPLPNSSAACTVNYRPSGLGTSTRKDTVVAAYAGNGTYSSSQGSVTVAVEPMIWLMSGAVSWSVVRPS